MHLSILIAVLPTIFYHTIAAPTTPDEPNTPHILGKRQVTDCKGGRFGSITPHDINNIHDQATAHGPFVFAPNAGPIVLSSGDCQAAIRPTNPVLGGTATAQNIGLAALDIYFECVTLHYQEASGRGWAGEVTGIPGATPQQSFTFTAYQYENGGAAQGGAASVGTSRRKVD